MKIIQNFLTKNNCYLKGQTITVKGIMVHSTACPRSFCQQFYKGMEYRKAQWAKCMCPCLYR